MHRLHAIASRYRFFMKSLSEGVFFIGNGGKYRGKFAEKELKREISWNQENFAQPWKFRVIFRVSRKFGASTNGVTPTNY